MTASIVVAINDLTIFCILLGGIMGTELGKRKNRFDNDEHASGAGCKSHSSVDSYSLRFLIHIRNLFIHLVGLLKKKKVYIPVHEHPDINFLGKFCVD
jgi:hypothetical protein